MKKKVAKKKENSNFCLFLGVHTIFLSWPINIRPLVATKQNQTSTCSLSSPHCPNQNVAQTWAKQKKTDTVDKKVQLFECQKRHFWRTPGTPCRSISSISAPPLISYSQITREIILLMILSQHLPPIILFVFSLVAHHAIDSATNISEFPEDVLPVC